MNLLRTIKTGDDLKKLSKNQLPALAKEIRERIISVVSKNGGHLASSLGVVELTIAIHYVFNIPSDSLVWDVGHQAYTHKLLTGRDDRFDSLRKFKGISGFTKRSESLCDAFTVGHSSTSISAGLGISVAKHLKKDNSKVISVIGDGSMTAGLAYEGLNQAGDSKRDLIVILNDNDMSIAPNVGALSSFLSRTLSANYLQSMKKDFGAFLKSLPGIGDDIYRIAKKSENSFKTFVTPGMLFEAFNFDYFGPIDGHRLNHLIDIMENIKHLNEPVLLHVTTKKGKGYEPAEKNPVYFHGVSSFDITTGCSSTNSNNSLKADQSLNTSANTLNDKNLILPYPIPTYTDVFGKTMVDLAKQDNKVVAITAAMPEGTGLAQFAKRFPERFFDVGIAEQHAVTFAAGMASQGMKPVVAIYSTFMQRAYDQILHDVCIDSHHVVFALDRGGIVGEDGPTHHGLFDYSFLRSIPNMTIMAPKDENELALMLKKAIDYKGPIAIRYPRGRGEGLVNYCAKDSTAEHSFTGLNSNKNPIQKTKEIQIGKAELLQDGKDILILASGRTVQEAIKAIDEIERSQKNISIALVNARFIKPLDSGLILNLASKIHNIITVEEHVLDGGFGSAVLELLVDNGIFSKGFNYKVKRIGIKDKFVEHGSQNILRSEYKVDSAAILESVMEMVE
ncbi:MAG: 1-deoxy-D-xylulose-5-phosphate synthase [Desulfamplus sp.]|nr:1-deoxy-D-xylulose-5-phosphate synthase [Desulfamplus sp.]